tara:strand:- start:230 stop:742 length:513 start_codon:yes stop_codon:yes gene_type:complete
MRNKYIKLKETPGGGSCLFNAVAFGMLYYRGDNASNKKILELGKKLRRFTVKQIKELVYVDSNYKAVILGEMEYYDKLNNSQKIKKYVSNMKKSTSWGGEIEARILNGIVKVQGYRGIMIVDEDTNKKMNYFAGSISKSKSKDLIHIFLNNVNNGGCHFSFVIPRSSVSM